MYKNLYNIINAKKAILVESGGFKYKWKGTWLWKIKWKT